jgi:eukaryotic-like serine/threonine-protein kinase
MSSLQVDAEAARAQLERILSSPLFRRAGRGSALLRYLVGHAIEERPGPLKEYTVGVEALGRGPSFDPRVDPIVRAEASRLRDRLQRYYETAGASDPVLIRLPKGSYVPTLALRVEAPASGPEGPVSPSPDRHRLRPTWAIPALALLLLLVLALSARSPGTALTSAPLRVFDVELDAPWRLDSDVGPNFALSPDGTRLALVGRDPDGRTHLYARPLAEPSIRPLPGTEGARSPFFSPDGEWVGFWAGGSIRKVAFAGGDPVILAPATDLLGASWGEDGTIVAAISPTGRLWRVPEAGGEPGLLLDLSAEGSQPVWPHVLPGGRTVLYTVLSPAGADLSAVEAHALDTGQRSSLVRGGSFGRQLTGGYLAYVNQGTLYAVRFDERTLTVSGTPVPLLADVAYSGTFGFAQFDVDRTGTTVHRRSPEGGRFLMEWLDDGGTRGAVLEAAGRYGWPTLSPGGGKVALSRNAGGRSDLWVHDLAGGRGRSLPGAEEFVSTLWRSDSELLLGGLQGMAVVDVTEGTPPRRLTRTAKLQIPWSLSPDGAWLAYHEMDPATGFDLWTVPLSREGEGVVLGTPSPFLATPAYETFPTFSPDGRWIAYSSNESGRHEIYVRSFPDGTATVRVTEGGGRTPRWAPSGEILFLGADRRVRAVPLETEGATLVPGAPRLLSPVPLGDTGVLPGYDVAADGEMVLGLTSPTAQDGTVSGNRVTFSVNLASEVERRLPR